MQGNILHLRAPWTFVKRSKQFLRGNGHVAYQIKENNAHNMQAISLSLHAPTTP